MNKLKVIYLFLLIILVLLSILFSFTKGFVSYIDEKGNVIYVTEYLSSGSDDNIVVFGGLIFIIPFFIRIFRIKRNINLIESLIFTLFWVLELLFMIFGIELSNLYLTIIFGKNFIFLLWLLVFLILLLIILYNLILMAFISSKTNISKTGG